MSFSQMLEMLQEENKGKIVSGQQKDVLKPQAQSDIIRIKLEVITFRQIDHSPITNS